jgi:predicted  nucleic acid-binding Zn-ribbon protein
MAIPSVMQGLIKTEDGKIFELDSPKGATWLENVMSFRFEPTRDNKPYTVRKEASGYWYGYRKQNRKLHKKYIGKSSELNTAKLEEIAEALNTPPQPRVREVTNGVTDKVTQEVAEKVTIDRLTALELQVQALQESLEALREELQGKSESGNGDELPAVTDGKLHIELGNLRTENEKLRSELEDAKLPSGHLYQEIEQLKERNRLLIIKSREERQKLEEELKNLRYSFESAGRRLAEKQARLDELEELADLKQNSPPASDLSEKAAEVLSFFKPWLSPKAPKNLLSKLEEILEDD